MIFPPAPRAYYERFWERLSHGDAVAASTAFTDLVFRLGNNGVTPNDLGPGCADGLPDCDTVQNHPVLAATSTWTADGALTLRGELASRPNATFALEFFASHLCHIGEELPARWIKVRADIEIRAGEVPHISQQEYFQIYSRHMEFDRSRALHLSRYLHDLGVFLHFQDDDLLARTVILQNQWATEAVFRILDDESVKAQFGRFNRADCERLWRDSVYSDMHPELLALMQRFELCYELRDTTPQAWLAPQLLPPTKPNSMSRLR